MKFFKPFWLSFAALTFMLQAHAQQQTAFERRTDSDQATVLEFVQSKENIDIRKKASNLEISGDVRFVWQHMQEKGEILFIDENSSISEQNLDDYIRNRYTRLRGGSHVNRDGIPVSCNDFNVKFNLKCKYDFDQTWAMAHLQFNNLAGTASMNDCRGSFPVFNRSGDRILRNININREWGGKGSGFGSAINLKRAYIGHTLYADGGKRLDFEIGRRQLDDVFMSEIQFNNYFDGALFEFASEIDDKSDWYLSAGVFIVDQRVNHFGWVAEVGILNVLDTQFDLRYSFIDWTKRGINRCFILDSIGTKFEISQFTLAYQITPKIFGCDVPMELYGAFLINTAAEKNKFSNYKKANLGWYFDLYAGNVLKKGDWSFEFIYAYVQAQAVPDFDVCGVGRGNILNMRLTDFGPGSFDLLSSDLRDSRYSGSSRSSSSLSDVNGFFGRQGNANYQGCLFDFLYAITDNFSIDFSYEFSVPVEKTIGGPHHFQSLEIEFLYAF